MTLLRLLLLALTSQADYQVRVPDYGILDAVLKKHVRHDGTVDYAGVKADSPRLSRFINQLASVSPDSHPQLFPKREARLAYWINAYNASVLHAFSKDYPEKRLRLKGILGKAQFFYRQKHTFGGARRSLDDIETNSMRRGRKEPRIHFAIVCASASCPWLSREAYLPEKLEQQLEAQARRYFEQDRNFRLDINRNEVWLPRIFDWFRGDFGRDGEVLAFVARYRPKETEQLKQRRWKIRYFPYDWSPNDVPQKLSRPGSLPPR